MLTIFSLPQFAVLIRQVDGIDDDDHDEIDSAAPPPTPSTSRSTTSTTTRASNQARSATRSPSRMAQGDAAMQVRNRDDLHMTSALRDPLDHRPLSVNDFSGIAARFVISPIS